MVGEGKRKRTIAIEEAIVTTAVVIAGLALQFTLGSFDKAFLAFPVNIIALAALATLLFIKKGKLLTRLSSGSLSVILLTIVLLITLYMGLVPGNKTKISWPFVLIYLMTLINLTAVISLHLKEFSGKRIPFLLNHLGVLILLFAAGLGSADKSRYFMRVNEGAVEWRAEQSGANAQDGLKELPVAISLKNFEIDEYPANLAIIERATGEALPKGRALFIPAQENNFAKIERWSVRVDSIKYLPRYAPAAFVTVESLHNSDTMRGWVSCGNHFQRHKTLDINDNLCVAMTFPEPKSYSSDVIVYTQSGKQRSGTIKVNSPLTVGSWKIYQHSYDTQMGRDSLWSRFELVYDPWFIPALIGIIMMIAGAISLFWKGGAR
ncbi:MAG: hypothetical protein A2X17_06090 [Bacteroidetes bacterium GWF2_41_61]|nr:MAG: hypothetical protein A2X20_06865 [Bacteroidetes bacterium GWE2_40_15]OFY25781.1 MAG: hypothetical protein A2X17_06090 [Bacteroidetes bacterium GWF2_41_61]OFY89588.1 MAG: hypothetical protein A2266_04485 [Bacteroidetes bacterium RIFOXYA12_FULL_40_10]HBG23702.1 hypothetical protein [Rikenellaceae bacterium]HBZ26722.1 hypothetical protein [Rikenellaceae bacterium]